MMSQSFKLALVFLFSFASSLRAESDVKKTAQDVLEQMTLTYSQVEYMKADFNKVSKSNLLGTEEKTKGELEYSKKKFRLEVKGAQESIFIKGKKLFWHIQGKDVTVGNVDKAVPSVFESIFSDPKIWSTLKSSYVGKPGRMAVIKVKTMGKVPNIKEMTLTIDTKKMTLTSLVYTDDVNNSVSIKFKNIRFFNKAKDYRFSYETKKTDQVNRL